MVGRSLRQIVWARLRRDKVAMICLAILFIMYLIAIVVPLIADKIGIDPYGLHKELINNAAGGKPKGDFGGITLAHPFGVEWGTGRDIFSQVLFGMRISLVIATSAAFLTVVIGTTVGIIAGYSG